MENGSYITAPLSDIGERYADLRIIVPQAERAMERSMRHYGQMTPVVVGCEDGNTYEMVDGFKRLRAGRKLGLESLQAKVLPGGQRALKVAIIHLNARTRTIADLETGMVIRSLYREDGLNQVQIAALLGRHKSFVCRRLRLIEKLNDEVLEHLKLGLINMTTGRELSRLPHGNQAEALSTIIEYRFNCEETSRLVSLLLGQPNWNVEEILRSPELIMTDPKPQRSKIGQRPDLYERLVKIQVYLKTVSDAQLKHSPKDAVLSLINHITNAMRDIRKRLEKQC